MASASFLLDCPDEVFVQICTSLDSLASIYAVGETCGALREQVRNARVLWRDRCSALLGAPLLHLHQVAWGGGATSTTDSARFYRRLYRAAVTCETVAYARSMQRSMIAPHGDDADTLLAATGHTATACAHLVAVIGGWRPRCASQHMHTYVADLRAPGRLVVPTLAPGSAKPPCRLRHASCAVRRPSWAVAAAEAIEQCVLVVGGVSDDDRGGGDDDDADEGGGAPVVARGDPVGGRALTPPQPSPSPPP